MMHLFGPTSHMMHLKQTHIHDAIIWTAMMHLKQTHIHDALIRTQMMHLKQKHIYDAIIRTHMMHLKQTHIHDAIFRTPGRGLSTASGGKDIRIRKSEFMARVKCLLKIKIKKKL